MFIHVPPSILTDAQWEWLSRHRVSVTSIRPLFAPVWVSFPLLPIHFRAKSSLFAIAKYIGAPLCVDKATSNLRRASEAWVCIEVDLKYKLPHRIWIEIEKMMAIVDYRVWEDGRLLFSLLTIGHIDEHCIVRSLPTSPPHTAPVIVSIDPTSQVTK